MKKKLITILSAVIAATVLLTACGTNKNSNGGSTSSSKADATQVLNIVGYDYSSLDPTIGSDSESATSSRNVYEGLYRDISENGVQKSVPALAEKTDISEDGTVYTFHLRKDAKWSDGKAITADQFVYSWKRLLDPSVASPYANFIDMVKGAEEYRTGKGSADDVGVKAVDDYTFEVTLKSANGYFEKLLSFTNLVPLRQDIVEAQGQSFGTEYSKMVYNGPFVIDSYQKGSKIVYKKNDNYWDKDNVKLAEVNGIIYQEASVGIKMFENKELDVVGASGDDLAKLQSEAEAGKYEQIKGYSPSSFYGLFNVETPALKNAKVRQAMSLALDRQEFLNVVYKRFVPALGLVPKAINVNGSEYRSQTEEPIKTLQSSVSDAKALFTEGAKAEGLDPSNVKLTLLLGPKTARSQTLAEYLQKVWKDKLGVNLELKFSVDGPSYFKDRSDGKYDICVGGWAADYDDPSTFFGIFTTGDGNNSSNYSNAEYDKLVGEANTEMDQGKRLELYTEAEKIVVADDPALAPLYYSDVNSFTQTYVKDYFVPNTNGYYDLKTVYISGK